MCQRANFWQSAIEIWQSSTEFLEFLPHCLPQIKFQMEKGFLYESIYKTPGENVGGIIFIIHSE